MIDLLQKLLAIALFRIGPQDLPPGPSAMLTCLILYVLIAGLSLMSPEAAANAAMVMLVAVAVPLILSRIILLAAGKLARWQQTVGALFGTSALLSALSLPFGWAAGDQASTVNGLILVAIFFWSLAVNGHIWRHALEVSFAGGLAISVLSFAATLFVVNAVTGSL